MMNISRMNRCIETNIRADLDRKMVFITGPRQVGKTFLAKNIAKLFQAPQYLNYDNLHDQRLRQPQNIGSIQIVDAAEWLIGLSV